MPVLNVSTKGQFLIKTEAAQIETGPPHKIFFHCIAQTHYGLRDPAFLYRRIISLEILTI